MSGWEVACELKRVRDELTVTLALLKRFVDENGDQLEVHCLHEVMARIDDAINQLDILADKVERPVLRLRGLELAHRIAMARMRME